MSQGTFSRRFAFWGGLAIAAILVSRLASLGQFALTDNTESRYGVIGLEMFRSGDWVTPWVYPCTHSSQFSDGLVLHRYVRGGFVPFWGKPPLQFWLTAVSYRVFGVSEWAARLPSFLLAAAIVAATVAFAARWWGRRVAVLAGIILSSSGLFLVPLRGVRSGHSADRQHERGHDGVCPVCLERPASQDMGRGVLLRTRVGRLAKGPVARSLVGLAVGLWIVVVGRWRLVANCRGSGDF